MKRMTCVAFCILLAGLPAGCGSDSKTDEAKPEKDRIERLGDGASTLGYDGEDLKKSLRDLQGANEDRSRQMDEVLNE